MRIERILSIDGGGVRGVIPVVVMQRLGAQPGLDGWLERVSLVAGTSTGGLIALGLAAGLGLDALRELYERRAARVFKDSLFDDILDLGKVIGADYNVANLARELDEVFGDRTLDELATRVLVTAFDLDNEDGAARTWKPKLFHNFPGSDSDGERRVAKVGTYTSAAPTYFQSEDGFIDGGVFATNPSMCALAQSQDRRIPAGDRADLDDVRLLSLGTGRSLIHVEGDRLDWGYAQWVRPLIALMLDGVNGIADYQCRQILEERYFRVAPTFPPDREIGMDAVDDIPYMIDFAESIDLTAATTWLRETW
jgi:hypothetical protein